MWEDSSFDGLSDDAKQHFRFLRDSLGHNFNSIMNDPSQSDASERSWFPAALSRVASGTSFASKSDEQLVQSLVPIPQMARADVMPYLSLIAQYEKERMRSGFGTGTSHRPHHSVVDGGDDVDVPISDVPHEFYSPTFDPCDPAVMRAYYPHITTVSSADTDDGQLLLRRWLRCVEAVLLQHIQSRSMDFFASLEEFTDVQRQISNLLSRIARLRDAIHQVQRSAVDDAMVVRATHAKREKQRAILAVMNDISVVRNAKGTIQSYLSLGRYTEAVDVYQEAISMLNSSLRAVECLSDLRAEFSEVRTNIVLVLTGEINAFLDDTGTGTSEEPSAVIRALLLLDGLTEPLMLYRSSLLQQQNVTIQNVVRQRLSGGEGDTTTKLRAMRAHDFISLIDAVFDVAAAWLEPVLAKLSLVVKEIRAAVDERRQATSNVMSTAGVMEALQETRPALLSALQTRIAKLLDARAEESSLRLCDVEALLVSSFAFVARCEKLFSGSEDSSTSQLRATLITMARTHFKRLHEKQKQKIVMVVGQEAWQPETQIEGMFVRTVKHMVDTSQGVIEAQRRRSVEARSMSTGPRDAAAVGPDVDDHHAEEYKSKLELAGRGFSVANSLLILTQTLGEYDDCLCTMPFLGNDVIQCINDLLRLYLAKCVEQLLAGRAVSEDTGLKSITPVHLALGAQVTDALLCLSQGLRARIALLLPPKLCVFLKTLEKFEKEAVSYRNDFYIKIIHLVMERIDSVPKPTPTPDGDVEPWRVGGNAWVIALLKEITRLMRTLKSVFDRPAMRMVVCPVVHQCCLRLQSAVRNFIDVGAVPAGSAARALVWDDLVLFKINLEKFGHSVSQGLRCRTLKEAEAEAMAVGEAPPDSEEDVEAFFFGGQKASE
eukprot:PhM_4_TR5426/c0_g1_i1/m.69494/K17600/VPS54; vacuolar protein sorting-associated protein 54